MHGPSSGSGDLHPQDLHPLDYGEGGTPLETPPTVRNATSSDLMQTAWALVERASVYCASSAGQSSGASSFFDTYPWGQEGVTWFIYQGAPQEASCSQRLQYEENLLCTADQLGTIADAVGTTIWPAICTGGGCGTFDYGSDGGVGSQALWNAEWDIPPQADSDRFIVRDMAIHVLGMLPTFDAMPAVDLPSTSACPNNVCTCETLFGDVAENGTGQTSPVAPQPIPIDSSSLGSDWSDMIFGVPTQSASCAALGQSGGCFPVYPPSAVPVYDLNAGTSYAPQIARTALQLEGQIMRAGGRLLHDLVRRDVYSDLAAAAKQEAAQVDPGQGTKAAWGFGDQGPYGAFAHAARVLTGRWEIGDLQSDFSDHGDPACEGVNAINLMTGTTPATAGISQQSQPSAYGSELSARVSDVPIRTKGEARAAELVGQSGIVLPSCAIAQAGPTSLKKALGGELAQLDAYRNSNHAPPVPVFQDAANSLSDDEIVFGFNYALITYRL
jgi:hypothetical protein